MFDFKENIVLENSRCKIEPLEWRHFDELLSISQEEPDLLRYSPSLFGSKENLRKYFESAFQDRELKFRYPFAIYDKAKNVYAGSTCFGNVSNADLRLEIGWTWLGQKFQRTGLNRSCKLLLLSFTFEDLNFERVEFKTDSRNIQSRRSIESIGGKYEGELRSHTLLTDGYRRNTVYYSILKSEWKMLKMK